MNQFASQSPRSDSRGLMLGRRVTVCLLLMGIAELCWAARIRAEVMADRSGTQWAPFVEWSLTNDSIDGNPYDLLASVTFVHSSSAEERNTEMFFAGDNIWKFRFSGTRPGKWSFTTKCSDPDLDARRGSVAIEPAKDTLGFVTNLQNKWARQQGPDGKPRAFVPQFVMYGHPGTFHAKPKQVDADIQTFMFDHGFTGFHVPVYCRWFDIENDRASNIRSGDPNPDPRTFAALERLIMKVHAAGGVVHLWAWGDESRRQTPRRWGLNGKADQRLQRYIAARLAPLPGWTMGYGFDLDEWVDETQLGRWRDYMHTHMGWPHMLGGRHGDPNRGVDHSTAVSWNRRLDYSSYEHHRPTYKVYVAALAAVPDKPVFSEDRFRIRQSDQYRFKDYTEEMTRRGLWHSTLSGGVANIWGKLDGDLSINMGHGKSQPYDNPHWIKTWSRFFRHRFKVDSQPAADLTNGLCLRNTAEQFVFYREDCDSIQFDLSSLTGSQPAVAVDTRKEYKELVLGQFSARRRAWKAPYKSDWAIAVGAYRSEP